MIFSIQPIIAFANWASTLSFVVLLITSYRYSKKLEKIESANQSAESQLERLQQANHAIAHEGKGKDGEMAVERMVGEVMSSMKMKYMTFRTYGLQEAILPPIPNDPHSREYDLILVCELGVYFFEVKTWYGTWDQATDDPLKIQTMRDTGVETREDPLPKIKDKMYALMGKKNNMAKLTALVVFADPGSKVGMSLTSNHLSINDLPYYFRRERDFRCNDFTFEVGDLGGRIFATLDHSSTAMHDHLMRLKPVTEDIKAYQINHAEIERLKEQPALPLPDRTFLSFSFYSFAFFLLMFLALKWKFHWS